MHRCPSCNRVWEPLTNVEVRVLDALSEGCSNKDIAARLNIGLANVKMRVRHIAIKLGIQHNENRARFALAQYWLSPLFREGLAALDIYPLRLQRRPAQ